MKSTCTRCTLDTGTDLIISEYVEGSNYNKALELFNPTELPVDLAAHQYDIQFYFNGSSTPGRTIPLTGNIAPDNTFVLAHGSADTAILTTANQTDGGNWFNGDDTIVLRRDGTILDVMGQIGFDPGTRWGSGDSSTAGNTLRRRPGICTGDTIATDAFLLAETWLGFPLNSFDGLGSHETDCSHAVTGTTLSTTVITYEYDDLYRLTDAHYRGDIIADYGYAYDVVGNRTSYTASLTNTVVTTYTYNAANQLETAKASDDLETWHYAYDGNGNRVRQVPGSLTPTEGETRYTFNQAGQMVRVENHDGISYTVQVDIAYTGLGHRVQGTTYLDGVPLTVTYTLDGMVGQPLVIANSAETTLILYGQYAIGEYKINAEDGEQWQYYLGDAELSVRQLVDDSGMVLLARTYAPYGILLTQTGNGASLFGYAGGQSGVSGLWYFGSGYFDPQTGQFLAQETNPMAPLAASVLANPGGLLFGPLMLWNWRRKKKGGKLPPTGLFVLALIFTIGLVGCGSDTTPPATGSAPALPPEIDPTRTPTTTATRIPTAIATATVVELTSTPPCTWTPTSTQTSTPTLTPTDDPRPAIPGEGYDLINFTWNPATYPRPTSSPSPISTPESGTASESEFDTWSEEDKQKIVDGAKATAEALRAVIHDLHPSWGLEAHEAFRLVYNGTVSFTLTGTSCPEGCWARSTGSNNVDVYTQGTEGISKDPYARHWAVHELGHCFVNAVGIEPNRPDNPIKILENAIIGDRFLDRPTRPIDATRDQKDRLLLYEENEPWGFAGKRWQWQRSLSTAEEEIFGDQYLGWVYGQWETTTINSITTLSDAGQSRSDFMNKYMPIWIQKAINNR